MLRRSTIFLLLSGTSLAPVNAATPASPVAFDIPESDLGAALNQLGRQAGVQISFPLDSTTGHRVSLLKGEMAPLDAVRRLVAGTALTVAEANADHILLTAGATPEPSAAGDQDLVVTGFRLATRRAIETKRKSTQIIDSKGNTVPLSAPTYAVYVYSGCRPACKRIGGPYSLEGQAIYGHLNANSTAFAVADYRLEQIDVYKYTPRALIYEYSFNNGLFESSIKGVTYNRRSEEQNR